MSTTGHQDATGTTPRTRIFDPVGDLAERLALLEASAGTGKTFNITALFLRLITEPEWTRTAENDGPVEPEQVLVVTFTKAATAEMRTWRCAWGLRLAHATPRIIRLH